MCILFIFLVTSTEHEPHTFQSIKERVQDVTHS